PAALRFLDPLLGVVVALEPDGRALLEGFADDLDHRVVDRLGFLERLSKLVGDLSNRVGNKNVEQSDWESDRGGRSDSAELEFLASKREGRSAVAVGIVARNLGKSSDPELDHLLLCAAGAFSGCDLLDDLGEHVAHEDRDDCGRSFVRAQPVLVAGRSNSRTEKTCVLVDTLQYRGQKQQEPQILVRGLSRLQKV